MHCNNFERENDNNAKFCSYCGNELILEQRDDQQTESTNFTREDTGKKSKDFKDLSLNKVSRKRIKRIGIVSVLIVALMVFIVLLSQNKNVPLSEEEIYSVAGNLVYDNHVLYNLYNRNVNIVERTTSKENKSDIILVEVVASNDIIEVKCMCELKYYLYENGWECVYSDILEETYNILNTNITEADALESLKSHYGQEREYTFLEHNTDLDSGMDWYIYQVFDRDGYLGVAEEVQITYMFDFELGSWTFSNINSGGQKYDWNVLGNWSYKNSHADLHMVIYQVTPDDIAFEYDFSYEISYETIASFRVNSFDYSSSGVEKRTYMLQDDSIRFALLEGDVNTPHVTIDKYKGVCFDGVWQLPDDTYIFSYDDGEGLAIPSEFNIWPDTVALSDVNLVWSPDGIFNYGGDGEDINGNVFSDLFSHISDSGVAQNVFDIYGQYQELSGVVFLPEEFNPGEQNSTFKVYGDGKLLYEYNSISFTQEHSYENFKVNVTGVRELAIEFSGEHKGSWLFGIFPAIFASDLTLTKYDSFDFYGSYGDDAQNLNGWIKDKSNLLDSMNSFHGNTDLQPYLALVSFDESFFELNDNFDYQLDQENVEQYGNELYDELFDDGDHFLVCYFSGRNDSPEDKSGEIHIVYRSKLVDDYGLDSLFLSNIDNTLKMSEMFANAFYSIDILNIREDNPDSKEGNDFILNDVNSICIEVSALAVRVRSIPSGDGEVISSAEIGDRFILTDKVQDVDGKIWYQILIDETTGYIRSDCAEIIMQ